MIEKYKNTAPVIASTAYVHESAHVIGRVIIKDRASVFPGAVLRGDTGEITVGEKSNIQDNATVHENTCIGSCVTVGHNAVVHGALIEDNCLIGMGAVVLDRAIIGKGSVIGAGCVIPSGKIIPPLSVAVGNPYRIIRSGDPETEKSNIRNAETYLALVSDYKKQ